MLHQRMGGRRKSSKAAEIGAAPVIWGRRALVFNGMALAFEAVMTPMQAVAQTGSELDDIDALVRTYRPRLLRFVMFSIGDADLAESITQDCFLKAYNGRASFRGDCAINTWLTSIAMNLIRD